MSDMSDQDEGHPLELNEEDHDTTPSLYAVLGVRSDADPATIRKAFLSLSGAYHTDKHALQSEEVQSMMGSRFQQLTEAYEVLSDPRKRAAYDGSGKHWESRLELVPVTHQTAADVRRYIDVLEAEAECKRVSTMLSASSATTLDLSVAHWFTNTAVQKKLVGQRKGLADDANAPRLADEFKRPHQVEEASPAVKEEAATPAPVAPQEVSPAADSDQQVPTPPSTPEGEASPPATEAPPAAAQPNIMGNLSVAQIEVNGEMQFVAILPPNIQEQLKNNPQVQQSMGAGVGGAATGGSSTPPKKNGVLSAMFVVQSLSGSYAFNHPVSPTSMLSFKGESAHNRRGGTNSLVVSWTKIMGVARAGVSLKASMAGLEYRFKWSRALSALTNLAVNYNFKQLAATLSRKLSAATTISNTLTLTGAEEGGSFTSGIQYAISAIQHFGGDVSMGYGSLALSATHVFLIHPSFKLTQSVATQLLSGRTYLSYELVWMKSKMHHLGVRISTTLPCSVSPLGGVLWGEPCLAMNQVSLTYSRGDHSIGIPIVLSVSDKVSRALQVFGAPLALYGIGRLLVQPVLKMNRMREVRRIRAEMMDEVNAARNRCKQEMVALYASIKKRRAHEAGSDGLVITSATYGVLQPVPTTNTTEDTPTPETTAPAPSNIDFPVLDITDALQNLVHDATLELAAGSKTHLPGIVDVDPGTGEKKRIRIAYTHQGLSHVAEYPEDAPISLPQESHQSPV